MFSRISEIITRGGESMNKKNLLIILLTLLCLFMVMTGCNKKTQESEEKKQGTTESEPKTPKAINEIENISLSVMQQIEQIPKVERDMTIQERKAAYQKESLQLAQPAQGDQQEEGSSQEGEKEEGPVEVTISNEIPMEKPVLEDVLTLSMPEGNMQEQEDEMITLPELWAKVEKNIVEINTKWNQLETELMKRNVPLEMIREFEEGIDNLTVYASEKKPLFCLMYANGLTYYLAQFRAYYQDKISPIVLTMKYLTRQVVLDNYAGNAQQALEDVSKLEAKQNEVKYKFLEKDKQDELQKFEMAVEDLKTAVTKQNKVLVKVKATVLLNNIKEAEKIFKEK